MADDRLILHTLDITPKAAGKIDILMDINDGRNADGDSNDQVIDINEQDLEF